VTTGGPSDEEEDVTLRPAASDERSRQSSAAAASEKWLPDGFQAIGPPLGAGATAVVWPVRRALDGREFALKVWRHPFSDEAERERFRREVRQQLALNGVSGHVVTYSWAEEGPPGGPAWIGMERHGASLEQRLQKQRPALDEGLVLSADLLAGLAAVHDRGLLHRDVKPGNVVAQGGRAKLCDLGLVLDSGGMTRDNAAGTPQYTAPELLAGSAAPSPRTDVYSAAQTIREILGPDLPERLAQLLTEAASVDPADRPVDAADFRERLCRVAESLGQRLPPPLRPGPGRSDEPGLGRLGANPRTEASQSWRQRRVGAGVLLLGSLLALAVWVLGSQPWSEDGQREAGDANEPDTAGARTVRPDAAFAERDITADGQPVLLPSTKAGQCEVVVDGAQRKADRPYVIDGDEIARIWIYHSADARQACAKLVKPEGSRLRGVRSHLAITLCGDGNVCDHDWNAYPIDAGPVVVPSRDGCISWRASMMDERAGQWLLRDDVQSSGCG
jgi:hypothetical protein